MDGFEEVRKIFEDVEEVIFDVFDVFLYWKDGVLLFFIEGDGLDSILLSGFLV